MGKTIRKSLRFILHVELGGININEKIYRDINNNYINEFNRVQSREET